MKKVNVYLCFMFLFSLVYDFSSSVFAEDITGFRSMKWGDPLPKEGMTFFKKDLAYGGIGYYKRDGDELKIGEAELNKIAYVYWNGKFCILEMDCTGYHNFSG